MRNKFCFILLLCACAFIRSNAQVEIEQKPPEEVSVSDSKAKSEHHFKVGLFLPFFKEGNDTTPQKHAFAVSSLDYLAGVKVAIDSIEKTGNVKIDFYVEDTELDSSKVEDLLMGSRYKDLDVLIGPIFQSGIEMAESFIQNRKTVLYMPFEKEFNFGIHGKFISSQKSVFSFAEYFSYFFLNKYENSGKQYVLIYNSKEGKIGRETRETDSLIKIKIMEKNGDASVTIIDIAAKENANFATQLNNSKSYVFFINSKNTYYANIALKQIGKLNSESPEVYCMDDILESETPLYELWDSLHVKFFSRFFVNYEHDQTGIFRKKIMESYNEEPVEFTYKGYNDVLFLSDAFLEGEDWLAHCQNKNYTNEVFGFYYSTDPSNKGIFNGYHGVWRYENLKLYRVY